MQGVNQSRVDKSTEQWLDRIEDKLNYQKWYCGHYHTEKKIDKLEIMFENIDEFCSWMQSFSQMPAQVFEKKYFLSHA